MRKRQKKKNAKNDRKILLKQLMAEMIELEHEMQLERIDTVNERATSQSNAEIRGCLS